MTLLQILSLSVLMLLVAGCVLTRQSGVKLDAEVDPIYPMLLQSARRIERSLTLLAEAEQFEKMQQSSNQPRITKAIPGMGQTVSMPWQGPLEKAVSKLAEIAGFTMKFLGRPPAIPILVQVGEDAATVSDHLRNLGIQAGERADVVVDPAQKLIEVRYGNGGV